MITYLKLTNFKCFKEIELNDIKPITLISGCSGSGKTSLLEAIFLLSSYLLPDAVKRLNNFRNFPAPIQASTLFSPLFNLANERQDAAAVIELQADNIKSRLTLTKNLGFFSDLSQIAGLNIPLFSLTPQLLSQAQANQDYALDFAFTQQDPAAAAPYAEQGCFIPAPPGIFRQVKSRSEGLPDMPLCRFLNSRLPIGDLMDLLMKVTSDGRLSELLDILRLADPRIKDLRPAFYSSDLRSLCVVYAAEGPVPLELAGDGLRQLTSIMLSLLALKDCVMLIDEIEACFYYEQFPELWQLTAQYCQEQNNQLIAVTGSRDCLMGLQQSLDAEKLQHDCCLFKLSLTDKAADRCSSLKQGEEHTRLTAAEPELVPQVQRFRGEQLASTLGADLKLN